MALNERERVIAWVVGGVVGAAVLYFGANWLYFDRKADLHKQMVEIDKLINSSRKDIWDSQDSFKKWGELGIQNLPEDVEQPTRTIIFQLASQNGFQIKSWSASGAHSISKQPDFQEVTFNAGADTTTARLGRFLTMLESQHGLAIRLDDLSIGSRKPGQDDLHVEMTIKALIYSPKIKADLAMKPPSTASVPKNVAPGTPALARSGGAATRAATNAAGRTPGGAGTPVALAQPTATYNPLNAVLGSIDPGLPPGPSLEEQMKLRREYQLEGKKLPKPRFGDEPLAIEAGLTVEQAMAKRKEEQEKTAATQLAAAEAAAAAAAEAAKPKLLPGETMEQYLERKRKELEQGLPTTPATSTAPGGI